MSGRDWKRLIAEQKESGLSQAAFAKERGVSVSALGYQIKKSRETGSFVRVDERIELELPGGVRLRVPERSLASVLKALQA